TAGTIRLQALRPFPTRRSSDLEALQALRGRHGAERIALVMGTSTSSIGASEEGYARAQVDAQGKACFPEDLQRPIVHTPHSLGRSEEHTSELQSRENLVCRLLR